MDTKEKDTQDIRDIAVSLNRLINDFIDKYNHDMTDEIVDYLTENDE